MKKNPHNLFFISCETIGPANFSNFIVFKVSFFSFIIARLYLSNMSSSEAASLQAGVFAGLNPAAYNPSDPIVLFIIQVYFRDIHLTI